MATLVSFENFAISTHASENMERRNIDEAVVSAVLRNPDEVVAVRDGRVVAQKRVAVLDEKPFLYRIVVDIDRYPPVVVTAYRTSKLEKYRSIEP